MVVDTAIELYIGGSICPESSLDQIELSLRYLRQLEKEAIAGDKKKKKLKTKQ